jgi:starvation-inducible outer membrane lipoprotein
VRQGRWGGGVVRVEHDQTSVILHLAARKL